MCCTGDKLTLVRGQKCPWKKFRTSNDPTNTKPWKTRVWRFPEVFSGIPKNDRHKRNRNNHVIFKC